MKASIIIPTYNEGKDLEKCLRSLAVQSEKDSEIIVIDDGSSDGTIEMLKNLKQSFSNLSFVKKNHGGAGAARNRGAKLAKGKILVFVDADMTFHKDFIKNLIAPILKNQVKGTFSKDEYVSNWENIWAKCWNINENWEPKRRHPASYPDEQAVFRAILKSEFEKVGGFTPGGYDDDWSLGKKLGYSAKVSRNSVFYHKNPSSLKEIFNHSKWVGKRNYKLGKFGALIALARASFPVSIILGVYKAVKYTIPQFVVFKIVYDLGIVTGIFNFLFTGNASK
jgi:glycosyltransferase involved in cell wall biosynthesis